MIGLVVPYAGGTAATIAACNLVLTVPVGLARTMVPIADVRQVPLPCEMRKIKLSM